MFKFLEQQRCNQPRKTCIKLLPAMVYGHTHESPPHMLNSHSISYKPSKNIPIGTVSQNVKLPPCVRDEFNIATQYRSEKSRKQLRRNQSESQVFGITQGQFSNFMDRHKNYNSIAVLHKENSETSNLANQVKKSLLKSKWNKSTNTRNNFNSQQSSLKSSVTNSFKARNSSLGNQSVPYSRSATVSIIQKPLNILEFRKRREQFAQNARVEKDIKRKTLGVNFALPSNGADHQLYFAWKGRNHEKTLSFNEGKQMNQDLECFEKRMMFKLK